MEPVPKLYSFVRAQTPSVSDRATVLEQALEFLKAFSAQIIKFWNRLYDKARRARRTREVDEAHVEQLVPAERESQRRPLRPDFEWVLVLSNRPLRHEKLLGNSAA